MAAMCRPSSARLCLLSWRVASPALKNRCFSEQISRGTGEKEGALEKVSLQEVVS